jgi:hypothetical protein
MTEEQWLVCPNPWPMLDEVKDAVSSRKMWLFAVACCRRVWHLLRSSGARCLVEATEQLADGSLTRGAWEEAVIQVSPTREPNGDAGRLPTDRAAYAASQLLLVHAYEAAVHSSFHSYAAMQLAEGPVAPDWFLDLGRNPPFGARRFPDRHRERATQADILRCLVGNPFRTMTIAESWLRWNNGAVVQLAQTAYDNRSTPSGALDNGRLMVLADGLEDAGSTETTILCHLRDPGPHFRGCWVVDALLAKW